MTAPATATGDTSPAVMVSYWPRITLPSAFRSNFDDWCHESACAGVAFGTVGGQFDLGVNDRCTGTVEQPRFRRSRRDIRRRSCRRSFGEACIAAVDGIQPKKS